jgi:prolyl 4-hydroxylase
MAWRFGTLVEYSLISIALYIFVLSPYISPYFSNSSPEGDVTASYEKIESLVYPDEDLKCQEHAFKTHVLSRDPLVIYVESFLSAKEADELVELRYSS